MNTDSFTSFVQILSALQQQLLQVRHRHLVVVDDGDGDWSATLAEHCCRELGGAVLWLGVPPGDAGADWQVLSQAHPDQVVGLETLQLVMDARQTFNPDLFAAVAGTVAGGGLMFLLTPPLARWSSSPFQEYFCRCLRSHAGVSLISRQRPPPVVKISGDATPEPPALPTTEQQQAMAAILKTARGHRHRPLVLISDRGRGKSSVLGMAAAALFDDGIEDIVLTAPRRTAALQVFEHFHRLSGSHRNLNYLGPDQLLQQRSNAALIMVDEAAAIPVPILQRIVQRYPRVVFATTVHGYEGTGRGFALRFADFLRRHFPNGRQLELRTPVRWSDADPLERFLGEALLLDAAGPPVDPDSTEPIEIEVWRDRRALLEQRQWLAGIFALLVDAHYQTRPRDLRYLLDDPGICLLVARQGETVAGVCLMMNEEAVPGELVAPIIDGRRRAHGRVLAQILLAHLGLKQAAASRYSRILRIAVPEPLRRRGLATRLLERAAQLAREQGSQILGVSFAAERQLPDFWYRQGYRLAYLGLSRDQAGGGHSAVMLKALQDDADPVVNEAVATFRPLLRCWLRRGLSQLDPELVPELVRGTGILSHLPVSAGVSHYSTSLRSFHGVLPELEQFVFDAMRMMAWQRLGSISQRLLIRCIVQGQDIAELVEPSGLAGRRQTEQALREAVKELISLVADPGADAVASD